MAAALLDNIQKRSYFPAMSDRSDDLPISQPNSGQNPKSSPAHLIGLRRRLSSFSVKIQPISSDWAFHRSKSLPSLRDLTSSPLGKWWARSWSWFLSKKSACARDLEMNGEEERANMLGGNDQIKGTAPNFMHLFYKIRSEIKKLMGLNATLPTTQKFRYDSFSYAQNFDDGDRAQQ